MNENWWMNSETSFMVFIRLNVSQIINQLLPEFSTLPSNREIDTVTGTKKTWTQRHCTDYCDNTILRQLHILRICRKIVLSQNRKLLLVWNNLAITNTSILLFLYNLCLYFKNTHETWVPYFTQINFVEELPGEIAKLVNFWLQRENNIWNKKHHEQIKCTKLIKWNTRGGTKSLSNYNCTAYLTVTNRNNNKRSDITKLHHMHDSMS